MSSLFAAIVLLPVATTDGHLEINPVYGESVQAGVCVAAGRRVRLPEPTMADGVDGPDGRARIGGIPSRHVPVDELLRKSVVAPLVFLFREVEATDTGTPIHGVDVWFVAYGQLEIFDREEFLEQLFRMNREDARIHYLSPAELEQRQIHPTVGSRRERYVHAVFPLLDRVELSVTSRTFLSRTDDSLLFAARLDPRFASDEAFPNQWRTIMRGKDGRPRLGGPLPYQGAASYLKVTRLVEPQGALFVEYHVVFAEPRDWFRGANLLRSKLPILIQSQVRSFRRQLVREQALRERSG